MGLNKILNDCSIQLTKTITPVLTVNGVLVPNSKMKIYKVGTNKELSQLNIFDGKLAPALLDVSFELMISNGQFSYTFAGRNHIDRIEYSHFSEVQQKLIKSEMTSLFNIPDEWTNIIINSSLGGGITILLIIVLNLCRRIFRG